jgi:hypothetical protein
MNDRTYDRPARMPTSRSTGPTTGDRPRRQRSRDHPPDTLAAWSIRPATLITGQLRCDTFASTKCTSSMPTAAKRRGDKAPQIRGLPSGARRVDIPRDHHHQRLDVVAVGAGQRRRPRDAGAVGQDVVLGGWRVRPTGPGPLLNRVWRPGRARSRSPVGTSPACRRHATQPATVRAAAAKPWRGCVRPPAASRSSPRSEPEFPQKVLPWMLVCSMNRSLHRTTRSPSRLRRRTGEGCARSKAAGTRCAAAARPGRSTAAAGPSSQPKVTANVHIGRHPKIIFVGNSK